MKIHYLQHLPFEGLSYSETWLKENNHTITTTSFFEANFTLPNPEDIETVIILGVP